nr:immunoglobulin light chain junction region [Macaca mulatta]
DYFCCSYSTSGTWVF